MASEHGDGSLARCQGSDMPYAAHARPMPVLPKRSALWATLARLRGHSVTHVDFLEARVQRQLGHVTERGHALKFIRLEVRDV